MHTLIGLVGKRGSGKDTAAAALKPEGFTRIAFAEGLKDMLSALLRYAGCHPVASSDLLEGRLKNTPTPFLEGKTPRWAMQSLGTEWGRDQISQDLWVNTAFRRAEQFDKVVITDVRFPNEERAIHSHGGTIIRIVREHDHADTHPSETLIDSLCADVMVYNNGTIEDLHRKILIIAKELTPCQK